MLAGSQLISEIDAIHKVANNALRQKDLYAYIAVFAEKLAYKQLNGKIIGKRQLIKDINFYFTRIKNYTSEYERKDFSAGDDIITERLIQKAIVSTRVFIFFSNSWTVEREGVYEWEKIDGTWKIVKVEIIKEKTF